MKKTTSILMILCCLGMLYPQLKSAAFEENQNLFPVLNNRLRTGDIIFRQGKGLISQMFRTASKSEQKFSHAGVLVIENKIPFVYHIIGTDEDGKGGLLKEKLSDFCSSRNNTAFAYYRTTYLDNRSTEITSYLKQLLIHKVSFDDHFDLKSDNHQYCTEMIYKMIRDISGHKLPVSTFKGQDYVAIDNLCLDKGFHKITEYKYNFKP